MQLFIQTHGQVFTCLCLPVSSWIWQCSTKCTKASWIFIYSIQAHSTLVSKAPSLCSILKKIKSLKDLNARHQNFLHFSLLVIYLMKYLKRNRYSVFVWDCLTIFYCYLINDRFILTKKPLKSYCQLLQIFHDWL